MDLLQTIIASAVSTSSVIAIAAYLSREWFRRLVDRNLERLRHELRVDAQTRVIAVQSQMDFKERQLSEFYGPIYSRLKRGRVLVRLYKEGKLSEIQPKFWSLARETNSEIEAILLSRTNLIDGDVIPDSFIQFLTHVPIWHAFMDAPQRTRMPSSRELPEAYYSPEFEDDIYATTERLKSELHVLYSRYGISDTKPKRQVSSYD